MNVEKVLAYIARSRDIEGLRRIYKMAWERRNHLISLARKRRRDEAWEQVKAMNLKEGEMVFLHSHPEKHAMRSYTFLWAKPLTVVEIRPRRKEVVVRAPGLRMTWALSPRACVLFGLSREPTPEALADSLR
jgi:aminoglycoside N3'-acetyltransferase